MSTEPLPEARALAPPAPVAGTLRAGTCTISETQPANYLHGTDAVRSVGGAVGNNVFSQITLAANTVFDGINTAGDII